MTDASRLVCSEAFGSPFTLREFVEVLHKESEVVVSVPVAAIFVAVAVTVAKTIDELAKLVILNRNETAKSNGSAAAAPPELILGKE